MTNIERPRLLELDDCSATLAASVPPRIREAIDNYVWYGIPTGGFVRAVLSNDLMSAICRTDAQTLGAIGLIGQYVYNAVPRGCYGSHKAVTAHIERGRKALDFD